MDLLYFILLLIFVMMYLSSVIICGIYTEYAPKDEPDGERKEQSAPIPTSGGLPIATSSGFTFIFVIFIDKLMFGSASFSGLQNHIIRHTYWVYILLGMIALLLGAVDDRKSLNAKLKLFLLIVACLFATSLEGGVERIFLPVADSIFVLPVIVSILGSALWLFVFMNATNFMDGSNGLAMGTLAIMLLALIAPVTSLGSYESLENIPFVVAVAIFGFLFWNLQGKLYAGDAGSLFGGAVFASLGIYAAQDGNIWFPATLALPFLVDVFMTLIWRVRRGHNLLTPHRHHAYQLFIRSGWSHIKTALLWWGLAIICASAAIWAAGESKSMSAWMFFGLLGTGMTLWLLQRRIYGPKAA